MPELPKTFDEDKVEKLLHTLYDFVIGTKLTNAEIDYTMNALWMRVMANRVAFQAMLNLDAMVAAQEAHIPNYIK